MTHDVNAMLNRPRLFECCVHCGNSLEGYHPRSKYCSDTCKRKYRNVSEGNFPPPEYVGDYDLLPDHIKACFTPGDPDECWIYSKRSKSGYAINTTVRMFKAGAYRLIYLMMVGPIPAGHDLDHTCDNGPGGCVNWHHLRPATRQQNVNRTPWTVPGRHLAKTHCPSGHPYDEENTYWYGPNKEWRRCRICQKAQREATIARYSDRYAEMKRAYERSPRGRAIRQAARESRKARGLRP